MWCLPLDSCELLRMVEMMGFGRGANCAPWSLAVTTIHRIVALFRSSFESLQWGCEAFASLCEAKASHGGDDGIRTHDPLLAGQVLSQLSYTPMGAASQGCGVGHDLPSHTVASVVLSALQSLTSVFGMGTGGPSALI